MPSLKFSDVDLDHPWVAEHRLPVLTSPTVCYSYFVTVLVPEEELEASEWFALTAPTDEEAMLAASYLQYRISIFNYYKSFLDKMAKEPLDLDGGVNTVSLEKRKNGTWAYKMMTWTMHGSKPFINDPDPCNSLIELLDYIERDYTGGLNPKWQAWKEEHNL